MSKKDTEHIFKGLNKALPSMKQNLDRTKVAQGIPVTGVSMTGG